MLQNDLDDPERGMIFVCSATHKTKVRNCYLNSLSFVIYMQYKLFTYSDFCHGHVCVRKKETFGFDFFVQVILFSTRNLYKKKLRKKVRQKCMFIMQVNLYKFLERVSKV